MQIRRLFIALFLSLILMTSCKSDDKPANKVVPEFFPLAKGSSWTYQGKVKWTSPPDKVLEKDVTWKMEVMDTLDRGHVFAAFVKGHPSDLAWYDEDLKPGEYLILRLGTSKYFIIDQPRAGEVMKRMRDMDDFLGNILTEQDLFLELPLMKGDVFGEAGQMTRPDMFYFWFVEAIDSVRPENIQGLDPEKEYKRYTLTFQSAPDHQIVQFIPGVGITSYTYVHHGTVSEAYLNLVDFRLPPSKAETAR